MKTSRRAALGAYVAVGALLLAGCAQDSVGAPPTAPPNLGQTDGIVWPVRSTVWPTTDTSGPPRIAEYLPLNKARKNYSVCVSVPTQSTEYFRNMIFGAQTQASGGRFTVHVVSGDVQASSLAQAAWTKSCAASSDALVLAPILDATTASAYTSLLASEKASGKPVVVATPGLVADGVTSSVAPPQNLGTQQLGYWLNADADGKPGSIIVLAGPQGQQQVTNLVNGLLSTLPHSSLRLAAIYYGPLTPSDQRDLLIQALAEHPTAKYVVGLGIAIDSAVKLLKMSGKPDAHVLASLTYKQSIANDIAAGRVAVAVDDRTVAQGAMAVDTAVRILQGQHVPAVWAPSVQIMDGTSITYLDQTGSLAASTPGGH